MPKRLFKRGPLTAIPPGIKVVYEPAGHEKMSDVLDDFIEPYSDVADTEDAYRKLLMLGQMAWNTALLPDDERQVVTVHQCCYGCVEPCARTGTFAEERPLVLLGTSPGSCPLRAA